MNGRMRVKKPDPEYKVEWYVVLGMVVLGISALFAALNVKADYIYEANQDLYDLQTNSSGSTGLGSNDDSVSAAFDLGFTFTFYGNDYTQARMATNGCLHFILTGSYCGDYTPDPLPQYTYTLYPFWTDLIKDGGSAMRAKAFEDYTIFGWYNMREYNRANSDNSIEVWLYPNNTYEFRYGELDIISHDVLIGEQGSTSELYTYHFFDECNTGTTNISGTCVNYDWNSSSNAVNTLLEDGGSLYGDGTNQSLCATVPLTSVNCSGYAVAYFTQQCDLSALYDSSCTGYATAYFNQQCDLSALYNANCSGYAVAYFNQQCGLSSLYDEDCTGYAVAYFNQQCGLNTLYDSDCTGYAVAYLAQQCGLNTLYSSSCEGYEVAYFNQQCSLNDLYSSSCEGYAAAYLAQQCGLSALYDSSCTGYGAAYLAQQCGLNTLYASSCEGYATAYLAQQCGLNDLYDSACPNYGTAYRIQQCDEDAQYSPTCNGYVQDTVATYYVEDTTDYGYVEDSGVDDNPYAGMELTDQEGYESDVQEYGQEQVDESYGTDVLFEEGEYIVSDDTPLETWDDLDQQTDVYDEFVETYEFTEEVYLVSYDELEPTSLPFDSSEELIEDFVFHETVLVDDEDLDTYIEFETLEELDEWYEEELVQIKEEEELIVEIEEEILEEEEEILEEREALVAEEEKEERKGGITATQLNVVASSIQVASNSVAGTTAGTTVRTEGLGSSTSGTTSSSSSNYSSTSEVSDSSLVTSTAGVSDSSLVTSTAGGSGSSVVSNTAGNTTTTAVANSASGGGFSTSSSPSISDQIQTAQVQTNTVLSLSQDMGSTSGMGGSTQTVSNVSVIVTPLPGLDATPQVVMADVQVTDMQGEIDTAIGGVMTASEADQIADQIIAANIKEQQAEGQTTQEETGKYGDESTLVAFLGYVPGFDAYREATIPKQETWYEPRTIYADASISDNIDAFYGLARTSLNTMQSLINQQPNL